MNPLKRCKLGLFLTCILHLLAIRKKSAAYSILQGLTPVPGSTVSWIAQPDMVKCEQMFPSDGMQFKTAWTLQCEVLPNLISCDEKKN